jgi:deoxyribonuclease IV
MADKFSISLGTAGIPHTTKGSDTASGVRRVAELGLQAMEVEFVRGIHMGNEAALQVGAVAKECDVSLSVHAPYFINLCSDDEKKIEASKKRIQDSAELAGVMGASIVVFHPGYYGKLEETEAARRVRDACIEMKSKIPSSVLLGLETAGKNASFGTLTETVKICKEVRGLVPVVDFAHMYARQGGVIDYGKIFDGLKPLRLRHLHTHFSNVEFTARGERKHLAIGNRPPFGPLAKHILERKPKIGITIISESPAQELDSLKMKSVFEKLGYSFWG